MELEKSNTTPSANTYMPDSGCTRQEGRRLENMTSDGGYPSVEQGKG